MAQVVEKIINEEAFELLTKEVYGELKKKASVESVEAKIYRSEKNSVEKPDTEVIQEYFDTHKEEKAKNGDVFLITTIVDDEVYEVSSYLYETDWVAITGNVDANKVIIRKDFMGAGDYDKVGNYTKPLKGTATISAKGKSVDAFLTGMFTKTLQPKITAQPAVSGFALSGAKAVEVGTKIAEASFGTATLSAGTYEYGPATGVTAQSFKVDRIAQPTSFNKESVATTASGTDTNDGKGFIIGDGAEENVVSSLAYKVTVAHNKGVVAKTNTGENSSPEVAIAAGSKTQQTSAYTGFRKFFYGTSTDKTAIDSAYIRGLTNSTGAYKAQTLTLTVPAGATRVVVACIGTVKGVTKVINESSMNADITTAFVKQTVNVEGANGYTAKEYNAFVFEPAVAFEQQAILKVTLG
ncbi:MAG: hypothetical protein SOR11_07320 [Fusobacterium sp.]|uniref:hypothetical protein n=1 Tax=Fusobacterium sp. TaxID=68766 RepID=UPI002A74F6EB|nr:hypothetical protein [Fusobacterium sp.]MCF2639376.1 hypothetical protein [Fusobacterium varium]MDY3059791.1 hypothetical protein [Fusobacterium sp.]